MASTNTVHHAPSTLEDQFVSSAFAAEHFHTSANELTTWLDSDAQELMLRMGVSVGNSSVVQLKQELNALAVKYNTAFPDAQSHSNPPDVAKDIADRYEADVKAVYDKYFKTG
jgi:hypothetical protein